MLTNLLLLNLLWLVSCHPVGTVYPATAAMFGVVREWVNGALLRSYFNFFRQNFKQGLAIGFVWTAIGVILAGDLAVIARMNSGLRAPLLAVTFLLGLLYLFASLYLFPIMVNCRISWVGVLRGGLGSMRKAFGDGRQ